VQEATSSLLACLVAGCSLHSTATVTGVLQLGLELEWDVPGQDMPPLAAAISGRLVEAADLGHFASPGSPLGALAADLAQHMLSHRGEVIIYNTNAMPTLFCMFRMRQHCETGTYAVAAHHDPEVAPGCLALLQPNQLPVVCRESMGHAPRLRDIHHAGRTTTLLPDIHLAGLGAAS
jgi:hypothetical protein